MVDGRFSGPRMVTPPCDHGLAGAGQFAIAAALGRDIDDHRARRHAAPPCRAVIRMGAFLPGTAAVVMTTFCCGQHAGHQLALPAVELLAHGLGVAALVLGAGGFHVEHDEARAQAFDLLLDGGADVVAADHGAQAARGGDGLQARRRPRRSPARAPGRRCRRRSSAWGTCGAVRRRRAARPCSRRWSPWRRARPCFGRA